MSKVRVNFYLKNRAAKDRLEAYLMRTGRSLADVTKQLMAEVIDQERPLGSLPPARVRTNVKVDMDLLEAFRDRLKDLGAPEDCDARDVISELVNGFLDEKQAEALNQASKES